MSYKTPLLEKTYVAGGTVGAYRFAKFGSADNQVVQAAAATDAIVGVSGFVGAASGEAIDICMAGIGEVTLAATLTRGVQVTSDADGKAVAASDGNTVCGKILMSGVSGDVVPILLHAAGDSDANPVFQADVTVTTAQVKALNATPIELVAAPAAGYALDLDRAIFFLDYNSAAYDGIAAGEDLTIKYTDGSGAIQATIEATGFLDQTADQVRYVGKTTAAAFTPVAAAALVLHMATGEIATGNSPLKVRVFYRVLPATL